MCLLFPNQFRVFIFFNRRDFCLLFNREQLWAELGGEKWGMVPPVFHSFKKCKVVYETVSSHSCHLWLEITRSTSQFSNFSSGVRWTSPSKNNFGLPLKRADSELHTTRCRNSLCFCISLCKFLFFCKAARVTKMIKCK